MAHHYQESDVSCGVAALQMALERADHDAPGAARLAHELGTDLSGTRPEAFEAYLQRRGIRHWAWHGDVTVGDLRALAEDHALIVCSQSPVLRIGHFAVVDELRDDAVSLDDPWFGPCQCMGLQEFLDTWESRPVGGRPLAHWVLAIEVRRSAGPGPERDAPRDPPAT